MANICGKFNFLIVFLKIFVLSTFPIMKCPLLLALFGATLLMVPASGTILINEIHINPPTEDDGNFEYIELRSTTGGVEACTGLTLLIIDNNGNAVGEVVEAFDLNDLSTGENGLLLLGNNYDDAPLGGPWAGFRAPNTAVADPAGDPPWSGMGDGDIGPNGGLTFLLVGGWTGLTNANANSLGDVDVNNNSVLDWLENPRPAGSQAVQPYTVLVDSIGFRDLGNSPVRLPYTSADLNLRPGSPVTFGPDNISRRLSRAATPADQNNAAAWYGGNLAGSAGTAVAYDTQFFGDFKGQATPGQANLDAVPTVGDFLINEVAINPPGSNDGNYEYIEILNAGGGSASLQGLALLLIRSNDNDGPAALGTITEAWDLSTYTTGANGLLLLGNNYPEGDIPWGRSIDPNTQLADPAAPNNQNPVRWSSMGNEDIGSNNGFTLLLVQNFTGTLNQDLDTNNDGVLDFSPWTSIKDSVGFDQIGGIGKTYATAKLAPTPAYDIDNVSRKLGNTTANSAEAWYGGDYGGNSSFSIGFQDSAPRPAFGGFRGAATPGRLNLNAAPVPAPIRLYEVTVDPIPSPDNAAEFVELINTELTLGGMHGLTLVLADGNAGASNGNIVESIDLSNLSTGPNGLVILGDGYDTSSPYDTPDLLVTHPMTTREDPAGLDAGDIGPNGGLLILITKGAAPAVGSNVSAIPAADIVDSIGFGTSPNPAVSLISPGFTPDHLSRYPWELEANNAASWFSGELDPAFGNASTFYNGNFAGAYKGGVSPGRYNHAATPSNTTTLLLNELNINPPGADQSNEFIEYRAVPTSAFSTNDYTLLMIDSAGGNTGTIMEAWSLDGFATGTNGLLLTGAGYPATSPWTGPNAPAAATRLASPPFMDPGDIAGYSDNGSVSFLLVRHFNERVGLDLDAGTGTTNTGADDGIIDIMPIPWVVPAADAVGVLLWDSSVTPATWTGKLYGGVNLSQTAYTPDNLSRHGNNITANSAAAWYGGDILGSTGIATAFDPAERFPGGEFVGMVTPGHPNVGAGLDDAGDDDNDGAVNLIELALNMNPEVPDAEKLPQSGTVSVEGTVYPTIAYTRFLNGSTTGSTYAANGYRYEVQASLDLISWTGTTESVSTAPTGDGQTETAVFRPGTAYFQTVLGNGGTVYLRLRISRL
jgi:hypothetical protein